MAIILRHEIHSESRKKSGHSILVGAELPQVLLMLLSSPFLIASLVQYAMNEYTKSRSRHEVGVNSQEHRKYGP